MANEKQVSLLKGGLDGWNEWRDRNIGIEIDLSRAELTDAVLNEVDLTGVNLENANLRGAHLNYARLRNTNLRGANLSGAKLSYADLYYAHLENANLSHALLHSANLGYATLTGATLNGAGLDLANLTNAVLRDANLSKAKLLDTVFGNTDLATVRGLVSCRHLGPSTIDHRTLMRSGTLPLEFLRGCGVPDRLIDYLPSLIEVGPIRFYSCFISYSAANQDFADRLHADLQNRGVRCWFAPHDMKPGLKLHDQIDEAIRLCDRLLLILSEQSMASSWVKTEITKARKKEREQNCGVLFPVALVPYIDIRMWTAFVADFGEDLAQEIREYYLPDFSDWKNHAAYQQAFERLMKGFESGGKQA